MKATGDLDWAMGGFSDWDKARPVRPLMSEKQRNFAAGLKKLYPLVRSESFDDLLKKLKRASR